MTKEYTVKHTDRFSHYIVKIKQYITCYFLIYSSVSIL